MTVINTRNAETINIGQNGTYDVARYTTANVSVDMTPKLAVQYKKNNAGVVVGGDTIIDLDGATNIEQYILMYAYYKNTNITGTADLSSLKTVTGQYACQNMFRDCTGITSINLSSLEHVNGQYAFDQTFSGCTGITGTIDLSSLKDIKGPSGCRQMFYNCTGITSVDLSSLTEGYCSSMFYGCTSLASVDLSSLTLGRGQAYNGMFGGCTSLTSVNLSNLTSLYENQSLGSMFTGCTNLTSVDLSSLKDIGGSWMCSNMFKNCTSLTMVSFPALTRAAFGSSTNQFNKMLDGCSNITVHFPSNIQSIIGSWSDVTSGFSGTNTTVLFDLPSTAHLVGADTVEYERNPKYDTATALAWRVNGSSVLTATPYYTSGTTDPAVSDTIYSDSVCTTAVTTISSIS